MGRITEISPQKKNKNRVSLFIDGEFYAGLDAFTAEKHRLREGKEVDEAELSRAVFDSECASAFEKAAVLINIRLRSECEIRRYLAEKAYPKPVISAATEKLTDCRLLDDAAFAAAYIESKRAKWGMQKIRFMLKGFGIDSELLAETLEAAPDQTEEAYKLAVKYTGNKEIDKRKIFAHLAQKGFDFEAIEEALRKMDN